MVIFLRIVVNRILLFDEGVALLMIPYDLVTTQPSGFLRNSCAKHVHYWLQYKEFCFKKTSMFDRETGNRQTGFSILCLHTPSRDAKIDKES